MDEKKRKPRRLETDEDRFDRLQRQSQRNDADSAAADDEIDAMVKRSIKDHGA